jgi:hypothetical protein
MARRDWGTVDRTLDELKTSGWQGGTQIVGAAFAIAVHRRFAEGVGLCPAAHVLIDDFSHLTAEICGVHVAHPLRLEDGIGKAVHAARRRLAKAKVLGGRKAETQLDAQLVEEPLDVGIQVIAPGHEGQHGGLTPSPPAH